MLCDFIIVDKTKKASLYSQIYFSIRNSIETGALKKGTKLPSIRHLSADLGVSKTTVTGAYEQLCAEGYIASKPQSGYYVEAEFNKIARTHSITNNSKENIGTYYKYDFSGKSIDDKIININEWRKYVKDVINQSYLLTSYGEPQGEKALRYALQKYGLGTRSVNSGVDNIVVGAGTQPLLYILCSILGRNKTIAVDNSSYVQSEFVFKSFGYKIEYFESDKDGVTTKSLDKIKPDILLINPNFTNISGTSMPVTRRLEIILWAQQNNTLIIEDDYNGELRYSTRPTPCVQNYDTENTIYIGSFSKVLLPSVRISYMVLPGKYLEKYNEIKKLTNQTASKTEQLALAKYLNEGKIDIHLRKARRIYLEKSKVILDCADKYLKKYAEIIFNETSLYLIVKLKDNQDLGNFAEQLEQNSVCIMPNKTESNSFGLSFSGIAKEKIKDGIKIIAEILKNSN